MSTEVHSGRFGVIGKEVPHVSGTAAVHAALEHASRRERVIYTKSQPAMQVLRLSTPSEQPSRLRRNTKFLHWDSSRVSVLAP